MNNNDRKCFEQVTKFSKIFGNVKEDLGIVRKIFENIHKTSENHRKIIRSLWNISVKRCKPLKVFKTNSNNCVGDFGNLWKIIGNERVFVAVVLIGNTT